MLLYNVPEGSFEEDWGGSVYRRVVLKFVNRLILCLVNMPRSRAHCCRFGGSLLSVRIKLRGFLSVNCRFQAVKMSVLQLPRDMLPREHFLAFMSVLLWGTTRSFVVNVRGDKTFFHSYNAKWWAAVAFFFPRPAATKAFLVNLGNYEAVPNPPCTGRPWIKDRSMIWKPTTRRVVGWQFLTDSLEEYEKRM